MKAAGMAAFSFSRETMRKYRAAFRIPLHFAGASVTSPRPNGPAGHAVAVLYAGDDLVSRSRNQEKWSSKMPKMKTKSSAKKRFKITATGKVMAAAAGKRHGMIKRSNKFIRDARGTMVLAEPDGKKVIKNYLPNGL
jgi:large subunit ribosomal protein L35